MSAASRNLARLARHFERMSREAAEWDGGMPLYSASETWERARLMTQSTADEETWRHRIWSCRDGWYVRWMMRRLLRRA